MCKQKKDFLSSQLRLLTLQRTARWRKQEGGGLAKYWKSKVIRFSTLRLSPVPTLNNNDDNNNKTWAEAGCIQTWQFNHLRWVVSGDTLLVSRWTQMSRQGTEYYLHRQLNCHELTISLATDTCDGKQKFELECSRWVTHNLTRFPGHACTSHTSQNFWVSHGRSHVQGTCHTLPTTVTLSTHCKLRHSYTCWCWQEAGWM